MKVRVTWDALDVSAGRQINDLHGSRCAIVVFEHVRGSSQYGVLRFADYFCTKPMDITELLQLLNGDKFMPEPLR